MTDVMLDFLLPADIEGLARTALIVTLTAGATTFVLFLYTLGLRAATIIEARRVARVSEAWQEILAEATVNERKRALPPLRRREHTEVLQNWNRFRAMVIGESAQHLIRVGEQIGLTKIATRMLDSGRLTAQLLGTQTLGYLGNDIRWGDMRQLMETEHTALSITAATALVRIDPDRASAPLISAITQRTDWPRNSVSSILKLLGEDRISEPLAGAIRTADDQTRARLITYAQLFAPDIADGLAVEMLRDSHDPRVLAVALKMVSGRLGLPRLALLANHEVPFVRIQAAKTMGRLGQPEHIGPLERMLADHHWWVRYRAAQALVSLPFVGPNKLRNLARDHSDRYARDILQQALAEAGLA